MLDVRQTQEYAKYLKEIGWRVERKAEINYFIKKFSIIGTILKLQRPEEIRFDHVNKIGRKYRTFQTIIEPKTQLDAKHLVSLGFKLSKSPYLPTKTLILDLTKSKSALIKGLKKDARKAIERGEGFKINKLDSPEEIRKFRNAWKKSVKLSRHLPSIKKLLALKNAFNKSTSLFLASHNVNMEIIGGAIFTRSSEEISYYWQAFSNKEGRSTLSACSLLWKGILWAKSKGCKIFDFEGIFDPRFPNKSWRGFTHFKKSFGGTELEYPGAFVKNRLPI